MRKDLRFRLRSFEFSRCGKVDKRIAALWRSALVRDVQVTLQDVHHPRCHENGQRWPLIAVLFRAKGKGHTYR
jgi:hypothetical protein